jgi:hypothetical protein
MSVPVCLTCGHPEWDCTDGNGYAMVSCGCGTRYVPRVLGVAHRPALDRSVKVYRTLAKSMRRKQVNAKGKLI